MAPEPTPVKFLFNTTAYKPAYQLGGTLYCSVALSEELVRQGHSVTVLTTSYDGHEPLDVPTCTPCQVEGVTVLYYPSHIPWYQRLGIPYLSRTIRRNFPPQFAQWLREHGHRHDIYHTHMAFMQSTPTFARAARLHRKPYLFSQSGGYSPESLTYRAFKKHFYIHLIEKPSIRHAAALLSLTDTEAASYRALGLCNPTPIIPNGIHTAPLNQPFSPEDLSPAVGEALHRAKGKTLYLYLSRLHPTKGADIFTHAFIQAAKAHPDTFAILAGPDESSLASGLLESIRQAGLTDRFAYVGPVYGTDKAALLQRADAFVLPTLTEGLSIVILEALATGTYLITTPGAHFPQIEQHRLGSLAKRNVSSIADAMMDFLKIPQPQRREISDRGRELVSKNYTWPAVASQYAHLCETLPEP